jgi:hypothetical protein
VFSKLCQGIGHPDDSQMGRAPSHSMYFRDLGGRSGKGESGGVENAGLVSLVLQGALAATKSPKLPGRSTMKKSLVVLSLLLAARFAVAANLPATTSTFSSVFGGAAGGDVILLAPGNYGSFSGGTKSSMVTIQPNTTAGGTQANVILGSANLGASQNITIQNMTIGGGTVGNSSSPALHIHFVGNKFTGSLCINTPGDVNQDTLVDGNSFINVGQSCTEGRIGITGNNKNHSVANGVVISNNLISGPGPSDGIQITGGAYGTVIGPGNEFVGIKESGCGSVHCDPIQFYGAVRTTITGNYFHGNSTGIMSPDCNGSPMTLTNNVFVTDGEYPDQVVQAGASGDIISHNTFAGGARIRYGNPNGCGLSSNISVTNNVLTGGVWLSDGQSSGGLSMDYQLIPGGGAGSHTINGSPTYLGGTTPTTRAGYQLATGSLGVGAASDQTDIGVVIAGTQAQTPAPPSNLTGVVQ